MTHMQRSQFFASTLAQHPSGLWGFSQGGWAAPLAAVNHPHKIAFLVVVSACGISPAAQMRYGTAEQLRRQGYTTAAINQLTHLRTAVERYLRGTSDRSTAQAVVDQAAAQPWFPLANIPETLPSEPTSWQDMDFAPEPIFARVTCPALAFYGETDEWVPIDESIAAWQRASTATSGFDLTIHRLPGCDHIPTLEHRTDLDSISVDYANIMTDWIDRQVSN